MKKTFAFLMSGLMALSLAACGEDTDGNNTPGSSVDNNDIVDGGTSSQNGTPNGSTSNNGTTSNTVNDDNRVDSGAPGTSSNSADNSTIGLENDGVGAPNGSANSSKPVPQSGTITGTSYGQMLRNGRVNDSDGYLLDRENTVTPGTVVW